MLLMGSHFNMAKNLSNIKCFNHIFYVIDVQNRTIISIIDDILRVLLIMATLSALNKCIQQNIRSSAKLQQTQLTFDISNNFLAYQKGLSSFLPKFCMET